MDFNNRMKNKIKLYKNNELSKNKKKIQNGNEMYKKTQPLLEWNLCMTNV